MASDTVQQKSGPNDEAGISEFQSQAQSTLLVRRREVITPSSSSNAGIVTAEVDLNNFFLFYLWPRM